jgi:hypothetical protein
MSPFAYNETMANDYYPLSKDEALVRGLKWIDKKIEINIPDGITIMEASKIETLKSDSDIMKVAIKCEVSGKLFRIIKSELEFYRKYGLPLPRKHPDVRHMERMKKAS